MKRLYIALLGALLVGCQQQPVAVHTTIEKETFEHSEKDLLHRSNSYDKETIISSFADQHPKEWGESVTGVKTAFHTEEHELALTFDACGGQHGSKIDHQLISFLNDQAIPATLFVNSRWIDENKEAFLELAENPLFQIENHGTEHKPLSVSGETAWGIQGTDSVEEAYEEIMENHTKITELTGRSPELFRSGTAYYDEVAVEVASDLGISVVNFTILGDAGATYSSNQVKNALLDASPGDIALLHMNQPNSGTAKGVMEAVPLLKEKGFSFVKLENQNLR
ncbi:polysaccharide deacetylase family protein [Alkalihalobacillus algicola]|nr:polysaccharide deacetylase family protein [Alkalihalobacillus algicola]MCA0987674.1 polysaccharide deacetylase family protein [Alkalihalobacillus algicola]